MKVQHNTKLLLETCLSIVRDNIMGFCVQVWMCACPHVHIFLQGIKRSRGQCFQEARSRKILSYARLRMWKSHLDED